MAQLLDIPKAARALGVSPARVRQLIDQGDLDAQQVGRFWVVDPRSVRDRAAIDVSHGRPIAQRQVWRMAALADLPAASDVGMERFHASVRPQARWRLRHYLAGLADVAEPRDVAWRLRGRADQVLDRYAHPSVIRELLEDDRLVLSGAHGAAHHGSDLVPDPFVDAYVAAEDVAALERDHGLVDVDGSVNARLRVVGEPLAWWRSLDQLDQSPSPAPRLLVIADLSQRDDARAGIAARAMWSDLRSQLHEAAE